MKRKKIYGIFMLVAIAVFLFAGGRILQIYLNYQESQKVYEQMEGFTQKIEDQDLSPEAVPGETPGEAAAREMKEETGLSFMPDSYRWILTSWKKSIQMSLHGLRFLVWKLVIR